MSGFFDVLVASCANPKLEVISGLVLRQSRPVRGLLVLWRRRRLGRVGEVDPLRRVGDDDPFLVSSADPCRPPGNSTTATVNPRPHPCKRSFSCVNPQERLWSS
mmetsp:Transcript_30611/g.25835  ORF Transcript_30611/g.25835 Transcript_30611/m.25835 type:complete len:104 (-) Transcript_30611:13-324(-)